MEIECIPEFLQSRLIHRRNIGDTRKRGDLLAGGDHRLYLGAPS